MDSDSHPACLDLTKAPEYVSQVNIGNCHPPWNGMIFLHHTSIICLQVGGGMEGRACGDVASSRNFLCSRDVLAELESADMSVLNVTIVEGILKELRSWLMDQ
jgi:hypothetical protein